MTAELDRPGFAALLLGVPLLIGAAAVLFTGNLAITGYAVPAALGGLLLIALGVRRLDRSLETAG